MVGAVIVKDSRVIGEGYHAYAGAPHAEINALRAAGDARGADMYVTLEPCCHFGRTPPCVEALIASGIKRVFAAMIDPNPKVSGRGIAALEQAGIEVHIGLLEDQARRLNEAYIKFATTGLPFVTLKMAMSLDGKVATRTGASEWISCEASRKFVHRLRARSDAVCVGLGTVLADDPELTVRGVRCPRQPCRVIVDGLAETPLDARVLKSAGGPVFVAVTDRAQPERIRELTQAGARILRVEGGPLVEMQSLVRALAAQGITSVMLEGGGEVAASALGAGIVDKVLIFVAPKIIGGRGAKTPVEGAGVETIAEAMSVQGMSVRRIGSDIAIEGYPIYKS